MAYDSANQLIASSSDIVPYWLEGGITLTVNALSARTSPMLNSGGVGGNNNRVYCDNVEFTGSAIPEPSTIRFLTSGLGTLAGLRRKFRN